MTALSNSLILCGAASFSSARQSDRLLVIGQVFLGYYVENTLLSLSLIAEFSLGFSIPCEHIDVSMTSGTVLPLAAFVRPTAFAGCNGEAVLWSSFWEELALPFRDRIAAPSKRYRVA